jgi:hypothetical protein
VCDEISEGKEESDEEVDYFLIETMDLGKNWIL